jgi:hypothetical protein
VSPEDAISSTWFCAGGTADASGNADHLVRVVNAGADDLAGTITVIPSRPDAAAEPEPDPVEGDDAATTTVAPTTTAPPPVPDEVVVPIDVPAGDSTEVRLGDHIDTSFAAGLVELDGGAAAVEHELSGVNGSDVAPCASQASSTWYFAAGETTPDALEFLVFFNPFPDAAVVDVTFRTDEDVRTPEEFQGLVIPARSVLRREIGDFVTRRQHVSASVVARSGRLVVDRIMLFDGSQGRSGLDVALGAPEPAEVWYSPDGVVAESISERFIVYNPSATRAEVDLTLEPLDESVGPIEPFQLTVPSEGFQELVVSGEERIGSAIDAADVSFLRHGTRIVSLNQVPVVVERTLVGEPDTARAGFDIAAATPLLTERAVLMPDGQGEGGVVAVQNRDGEAGAEVTLATASGEAVESIEVPAATTVDIDLAALSVGDEVLVIDSTVPVAVERRRRFEDGTQIGHTIAVPVAGFLTRPSPPG